MHNRETICRRRAKSAIEGRKIRSDQEMATLRMTTVARNVGPGRSVYGKLKAKAAVNCHRWLSVRVNCRNCFNN